MERTFPKRGLRSEGSRRFWKKILEAKGMLGLSKFCKDCSTNFRYIKLNISEAGRKGGWFDSISKWLEVQTEVEVFMNILKKIFR